MSTIILFSLGLILLIVGGNDTTRNSISGGVLALNENPSELKKLNDNPGLIPNMVSEIIRWQTPLAHMRRTALSDAVVGGKQIRKGDKVVVITGRDKGRTGEVVEVRTAQGRAIVRGVNMVKRHQRQTATQEGGIVSKEGSIHLSNLALADPKDGKPTRVGFKLMSDGRKVRFAKRSGVEIDG